MASSNTHHAPGCVPKRTNLFAISALALIALSSAQCRPRVTAPQFQPTRISRTLRLFTDSDTVTGAAAGSVELYVGTTRGVLRYPLSGTGEMQRNTVAQGLPDDHVYAIAVSGEGIPFVATGAGVARLTGDRWERTTGTQPDVGTVTCMLALSRGTVLLGGTTGLAEYRDGAWAYLTRSHQITHLAPDGEAVLVSTAGSGMLVLNSDHLSGEDHSPSAGIPAALIRSSVSVEGGKIWALAQDGSGSRLAYFDGHRWFAYTHRQLRSEWLAVVPSRDGHGAALLVQGRWYDIVASSSHSDASLDPVSVSEADQAQRLSLRAEPVAPDGASAPAATTTTATTATTATSNSADMSFSADETGSAAQPSPVAPSRAAPARRVRAMEVPEPMAPVEAPSSPGAELAQAPGFALNAANIAVPPDIDGVYVDGARTWVAREGKGVTRLTGGEVRDFRAKDLVAFPRGLMFAMGANGQTWFLSSHNTLVGYDGRHWTRKPFHELLALDEETPADAAAMAQSVPLALWSRGQVSVAVARSAPDKLVIFRWNDGAFDPVLTRKVRIGRGATIEASCIAVDGNGRYWVGVSITRGNNTRPRGALLIDGNLPRSLEFHQLVRPRRNSASVQAPDNLTSVEFDNNGLPWFSGVEGAITIAVNGPRQPAAVRVYREAQGVRGDLVNDLVRGPSGFLYVSTPEGFGAWDGRSWDFQMTGARQLPPAVALAGDSSAVYGVGHRGAWIYDSGGGRMINGALRSGAGPLTDVAIDGRGRVWMLGEEGLLQFDPAAAQSEADSTSTGGTGEGAASTEGAASAESTTSATGGGTSSGSGSSGSGLDR